MERLEKDDTPAVAETVFRPESAPPPGFAPMATVMLALEPVTVFEKASCTVTWTAGAMGTPAVVSGGWTLKTSLDAAAGVMLKAAEMAAVSVPEVAVSV